ncbi:putative protein kinase RLK-Pelle-L-LEC family [Helianthus debilis subsp. tardiflorus]
MAISVYFLLFLIPQATSITFNWTNINPQNQNEIVTINDASISTAGLQLTPDEIRDTVSRATYVRSLHLWDKNSSEQASFSTEFSFVIESRLFADFYADGFTFFLAGNNSFLTGGGFLGLPVDNTTYAMKSPFVAVEFDTLWNADWDPANISQTDYHVGINVNSLSSSRYKKWSINITQGAHCQARIKYDSVSKNLTFSVTDIEYGVIELDYVIDLTLLLPEWVIFGFTAATGIRFEKITIKSWTFNSSSLPVDVKEVLPPPTTWRNPTKGKNRTGLIVGSIAGIFVVLFFLGICSFCLWRNKMKRNVIDMDGVDENMNKVFEMGTGPKRFAYDKVFQATSGFVESNKLGEGGFGGVYKGFLKDLGMYVAVKRMSKTSEQGIKEYESEVKIISRLRHKNLVELKGWCHEKGELLLVYDFMENGSLDLHLLKGKSLLKWGTRYNIARGLASALQYLHHEWEQCVLHRDIKSSNVMLDKDFNAKLGDFGLAKIVDHEKGFKTTILAGTLGYLAPECLVTFKASRESDVFSFGVVSLEIACGRKPIDPMASENQKKLTEWVWELYVSEGLLEAVDPRLGKDFEEEEIKRLMIVGLWCVHPNAELRPSMKQVYHVLNSEASLPVLPSWILLPSYLAPLVSSLISASSSEQEETFEN